MKKIFKNKKKSNKIIFSKKEMNKIAIKQIQRLKNQLILLLVELKNFTKNKIFIFTYKDKYKNQLSYKYSSLEKLGFIIRRNS